MSALMALYHRLPTPARSIAATMRGWYLRWWRYGPARERLEEEALAREQWSAAQWQAWREERLAYLLHRAATRVPYYRDQWAARRRLGDRASWELLEHWPILSKQHLRGNPRAFVADDRAVWRLYAEQSSGTTGTPVTVWKSRDAIARLYALSTTRARGWHGVSRGDRWAMIGGQVVVPVERRRPPFWVWNGALQQLYLSSYHLAPDLIPSYLDALRRYRVVYLMGYTSSLYALALEALRLGRRDVRLTVAITCAEPVVDYQRETIAQAFQCPVRETYGLVEMAAAASECTSGHLHLWPEVGILEALENDQPVAAGQVGDLVCTGLLNADMPLVRYAVGDRGALAPRTSPCPCGRPLPRLTAVAGRVDDVLYTPDGRRIGRLSPVVKGLAVREAQIVQEALSRIRIRYVPAPDFTAETERALVARLRERMGGVDVILEPVEHIPRAANGKFRAVVNALLPAERARVLGGIRG